MKSAALDPVPFFRSPPDRSLRGWKICCANKLAREISGKISSPLCLALVLVGIYAQPGFLSAFREVHGTRAVAGSIHRPRFLIRGPASTADLSRYLVLCIEIFQMQPREREREREGVRRAPVPLLVNRENRREYRARLSRFPVCRECSNKQCRGHWGNGRGGSPRGPTRIIQRPEARYRVGGILIENQPRITAAIYAKYPCLTTFAARRIELAASELKQRTEKKEEKKR